MTYAPDQSHTYPKIVEAPRTHNIPWVPDARPPIAPEQEYPEIVPAPPVVDTRCPTCGR